MMNDRKSSIPCVTSDANHPTTCKKRAAEKRRMFGSVGMLVRTDFQTGVLRCMCAAGAALAVARGLANYGKTLQKKRISIIAAAQRVSSSVMGRSLSRQICEQHRGPRTLLSPGFRTVDFFRMQSSTVAT
eukprot:1349414-Rhodomonas_salina.4